MTIVCRRIARLCGVTLLGVGLVFTLASWSGADADVLTFDPEEKLQQYSEDGYGVPKCGGSCLSDCCKIIRVM
jgi:hypothetical protein